MQSKITSCGIDFGTSNSALAVIDNAKVKLAAIEKNCSTIPSALFYQAHSNKTIFGNKAAEHFFEGDEGRYMRSLKRILGTSLIEQNTVINGKAKSFDTIIGDFINHLKTSAEEQFDTSLENAIMGRPVNFIDNDPEANIRAQNELESIARKAGFKNVEFQYEPIAAAFAHEQQLKSEKLALVVDIGGGTSDFTIICLGSNKNTLDRKDDILSNSGVRVGGNDFDKDLSLAVFMPEFGHLTSYGEKNLPLPLSPFHDMSEWSKVNFLYTPATISKIKQILKESHSPEKLRRFLKIIEDETGHRLLGKVEESKINLTHKDSYSTELDFIDEEFINISVSREEFDNSVKTQINSISQTIGECLKQSGLKEKDINLIILTGGTTEVPILKSTVKNRFPQAEISEENKLSSVCMGLGFDSLKRF